jgi:hypothetical protein
VIEVLREMREYADACVMHHKPHAIAIYNWIDAIEADSSHAALAARCAAYEEALRAVVRCAETCIVRYDEQTTHERMHEIARSALKGTP